MSYHHSTYWTSYLIGIETTINNQLGVLLPLLKRFRTLEQIKELVVTSLAELLS
jgi:hypothetical protein